MLVFRTDRLALRTLDPEGDAAFILELLNDPGWLRFIGDRGVRTLEDAAAYVRNGPATSWGQNGFALLAVERTETPGPIGMCGLLKRDALDAPDLGFAFLPAARGSGYAREAAAGALRWAREAHGLDRILAITSPDNERSIRLLEKLGFRFDRFVRLAADAEELRLWVRAEGASGG